jgi:undecaprenyl-diphosphatase
MGFLHRAAGQTSRRCEEADIPIAVVLIAAISAGAIVAGSVLRYPAVDPSAPAIRPTTVRRATRRHSSAARFFAAHLDPESAAGLLLTTALVIVIIAGVAIGALFIMVQHNALLARYDLSAARWGADNATPTTTKFLRDVSILGGTEAMIVVALAVAIAEYFRTRRRVVFAFMAIAIVGQVVLANGIKYIVNRPRPNIDRLTGFSGPSFPSGHAATAAITFAAAAFLLGRGRSNRVKAACAGLAAAIAVAVATTRVLLGVHWFTDVLAGLALGWGWFALCSLAFGGRLLRFGQPVAVAERAVEHAEPPRRTAQRC